MCEVENALEKESGKTMSGKRKTELDMEERVESFMPRTLRNRSESG